MRISIDIEEPTMSIVIEDLPESEELDKEAMAAIAGGGYGAGSHTQVATGNWDATNLHQYFLGYGKISGRRTSSQQRRYQIPISSRRLGWLDF